MYMVGTLWKWTNYIKGWQERWFILDNGILSYYKSQDDVSAGCKGSLKMSVCDIVVHNSDATRLDLIIPGEQHYYIKALNPKERQQWLVALGTAKASKGRGNEEDDNTSNDVVKAKRSELRLYCDLLMQQVHSVKMAVNEEEIPDVEKLDQATSLISPTCDAFINTLEECMRLIQMNLEFEGQQSPITDATLPQSPLRLPNKKGRITHRQGSHERVHVHSRTSSTASEANLFFRQNSRQRTYSDVLAPDIMDQLIPEHARVGDLSPSNLNHHHKVQSDPRDSKSQPRMPKSPETGSVTHLENGEKDIKRTLTSPDHNSNNSESVSDCDQGLQTSGEFVSGGEVFLDPIENKVQTFFSEMKPSFTDLTLLDEDGIPVEPFLNACKCLLPIFDKLNSTAFAPVKMDFQGNIRKVRTKYALHPEEFKTLQSIVLHEIGIRQNHLPSSATMALLWMKRSLEFIVGFMIEINKGEENLSKAASNAYTTSLKPYHGWVVRGVFAVAVKALPYRETFLSLMNLSDIPDTSPSFMSSLKQDMEAFSSSLSAILKILSDFFKKHDLDSDEQI